VGHLRAAVLRDDINYIDRQILSLLKPMLDSQLGWTSTQFGAINSAFQASYAISWHDIHFGCSRGKACSSARHSMAANCH
jgi:ACS family hexuronate transporter-like MFS transporter